MENGKILESKLSLIHTYFPKKVLNNETLAERYDGWTAEKIFAKTGIRERHIVAENEFASDLAVKAAENLFLKGRQAGMKLMSLLFALRPLTSPFLVLQRSFINDLDFLNNA